MTKTIFCDIDGTLVRHLGKGLACQTSAETFDTSFVLPGTVEKLNEWQAKGYTIVLTTGRRESQRRSTETQLHNLGLIWDHLVMGLPNGPRVLINDLKPGTNPEIDQGYLETAQAICLMRNKGIKDISI